MDELSMRPVQGRLNGNGTVWTIRQWKRLAHYMLYVRCAAFFDTLSLGFLMLIPMGRSEDIRLALRRREQREMKNKKSNVANLLEAQWVRGKAFLRGNRGTPWKKAPERLRSRSEVTLRCSTNDARCVGIGGSVFPDHGGTGSRDEAEQSHSACVHREATGRDRTLLLSTRTHGSMMMQATPQQGMLDVQYNHRTQPGRVRCSTCGPGELRGCRRAHGSPHCGGRDTVPLKAQEQLKGVDQEVLSPVDL